MPRYRPNVALILTNDEGKLLVCERVNKPDSWQFPQGGVDKGEELLDALKREVFEEIGLPPKAYKVLKSKDGYRYKYPKEVRHKKKPFEGQEQTFFLAKISSKSPAIDLSGPPREFSDYKWVSPQKYKLSWLPAFKRETYQKVFRDFFDLKKEFK